MSTRPTPAWAPTLAWRTFCLLTLAGLGWAGWRLFGDTPYRIDIDVYRMGGRAWLDNSPLYADGAMFATQGGLDLPFTYPPLAAIVFSPFAVMSLPAASAVITAITLSLLIVAVVIVLTRLDVWTAGRRLWLAAAVVAVAVVHFEPIEANFDFGQINVVLMTLVIADCVPRRTPWPRGVLVGLAIALKLTPAVFLLYFLLRRDMRALLVSAASVVALTVLGFALAWRDSWEYWTATVSNTDRIGSAALNTNQNIAGTLARFGAGEDLRFVLWVLACFAVLALTVWAARRALCAGQPVLALVCVAMFGLVVSPVSWSHHWVWSLPAVLVTLVVAYRTRHGWLAVAGALGCALMVWSPITLLPAHQETSASLWRQLAGGSYVWWALFVIAAAGTVSARSTHRSEPVRTVQPAAASGSRAAD
jgi:alpha-1,2-mannosyltransferase